VEEEASKEPAPGTCRVPFFLQKERGEGKKKKEGKEKKKKID